MRDIVVFLDLDVTGSTPQFLAAARKLELKPILFSLTPWMYHEVPAENAIRLQEMAFDGIISQIDRIGRERIAGIYTPSSHWAELAARVAQTIGRPHSDPDAIARCHDKMEMRQCLQRKGFTDVMFKKVSAAEEAYSFARNLGGSAVLKAGSTTGAHGVTVCRTPAEARDRASKLLRKQPNGLLIEEYVQGPLFGVEAANGKVYGLRRCFVADGSAPLLLGAEAPANVLAQTSEALTAHAEKALALIGYTRGAANVQAVFADGKPYLIEINPRAPAGTAPANIKAGLGVDIAEFCLRFACGRDAPVALRAKKRPSHYAVVRSLPRIKGSVLAVEGADAAAKVPQVKEVYLIPTLYGRRGPAANLADRVAYIQSVAPSAEAANESAVTAINKLVQVPESYLRYRLRRWRDKRLAKRINQNKNA